jgi:ABC-type uncharacterized transport system substrate-binding protein
MGAGRAGGAPGSAKPLRAHSASLLAGLYSAPVVVEPNQAELVALAARRRRPAVYSFRQFPDSGGLMSYGANVNAIHQRSAAFVDKILKGAKPGDLPVEQPTKFEMVINLRTAKALG